MQEHGYIYVRSNEYWDTQNVYKLGKTTNILDREQTYITSEIVRGKYTLIIEVDSAILDNVEKQLQNYFKYLNLHLQNNAGTEFFDQQISQLVIPYFLKNNIKHRLLNSTEIDMLVRKVYCDIQNSKTDHSYEDTYKPKYFQISIIDKACDHLQKYNKGLLILPCGAGKTLISLWITHKMKSNKILIGVPNKLLLNQWKVLCKIMFKKISCLIVSSCIQKTNVIEFLNKNSNQCIVITTYSSAFKIHEAGKINNFNFDMQINDEAHHLCSEAMQLDKVTREYVEMLHIKSTFQISLTATQKNFDNDKQDLNIVSNNNINYFGEIIDKKNMLWAINNHVICDYVIQTIVNDGEKIESFDIDGYNEERLFLSAFVAIKSIFDSNSHHLLVYLNNKENCYKLIGYIQKLLDKEYFIIPNVFFSSYHSDMKPQYQKHILNNYNKAKCGIIACVYCLGEGYDNHIIDGVVFAENMTSNIRIVQSALRAGRKNEHEKDKITKIILPIFNDKNWLDKNNSDFKKVREVIYQMGLEDETIEQKLHVIGVSVTKQLQNKSTKQDAIFEHNNIAMTEALKLKTIKRAELSITYDKAKLIIANKNLLSKESYYALCDKDIRLTKEPDIIFKGKFVDWIDYLGIKRIYYDKEICISKVNEYLNQYCKKDLCNDYLNLSKICGELCKLDNNFPPNGLWNDYYNIKDLQEIICLKAKKKKNTLLL